MTADLVRLLIGSEVGEGVAMQYGSHSLAHHDTRYYEIIDGVVVAAVALAVVLSIAPGTAGRFETIIAGGTLILLATAVWIVDEIAGETGDREAGKQTFVMRIGDAAAGGLVDSLFVAAFAIPLIAAFYTGVPFRVVALTAGMPPAIIASDLLGRGHAERPRLARMLTIAAYVVSGAGYAAASL